MSTARIFRLVSVTGLAIVALGGCAGKAIDQRLDQKLAAESAPPSASAVDAEAKQRIASTPDLTPEQRQQLEALRRSVREQVDTISRQTLKLRSILVKDLVTPDGYDVDEVRLIKSRLQDLSDRRLAVTFQAIDQANSILGHLASQHSEVFRDFTGDSLAGRGHE